MQLSFLNTIFVPNEDGTLTRTHPDSDSTPIVRVYRHTADALIEEPTPVKSTIHFASGCYSFPLTAILYYEGDWYYFVVTSVFTVEGEQFTHVTDRSDFRWSWRGDIDSNAAKGYNYNLFLALKVALEANSTLMNMLGHAVGSTGETNKIIRDSALRKRKKGFPCLTVKIPDQRKNDIIGGNVSGIRDSVLDFVFWNTDNNDDILLQMSDLLAEYLADSNNYKGLKIDTADGIFKSGYLGYDQHLSAPDDVGVIGFAGENINLFSSGCRFTLKAALLD